MICRHGVDSEHASCLNCQNERHRQVGMTLRKMIAPLSRYLAPILGHFEEDGCICCGIHDAITPRHDLWHREGSGSFALCKACWKDLSTEDKIKYYRIQYEKCWAASDPDGSEWEEIVLAIRHPFYWKNKTGTYLTIEEIR